MSPEFAIPDHFRCPISLDLMRDPVTAPTGITYDRQSIERWLDTGKSTCPVTNRALAGEDLIPNHAIRRLIQDWCVTNRSRGIERIPTPRIPISSWDASAILSDISSASHRRDDDRCLELARRVRSLAKESERNRRCFVSNAGPRVLSASFRLSMAESLEMPMEILAALVALLPFEDGTELLELGSPESLNLIAKIMKHGDIGGKLNSVMVVKKMVFFGEALKKAISENSGLVEALAEFIKDPVSLQATKASMVAIFLLISGDEETAMRFVELGLIPPILEMLVDSDKSMTEKALAVLDGLCECDPGREAACRNALAIPVLAKKMFRVSDMATESAVSTMWRLCRSCAGGCLVECLQVGVFQKLLLLLQVDCGGKSKEKATEMLKLMSGYRGKLECIDTVDFKGLKRR